MSLQLEGVTVRRGIGPVVSDVSLEVAPGSIVALVGPNGAGKTSLLEAVSGVVATVDGRIAMDSADLRRMSRRRRSLAGLKHVEQGRTIFPSLTVGEHLRLAAHGREDVDAALALFPELKKRLDSAAVLLSGGEQQMVVLARALVARPRYLLLDEMSLGLAPVVFLRLLPAIQQVAATGVGVLLVEQFARLALRVADDVLVVASGRVTYHGPPAALLADDALLQEAYLS